MIYYKPPTIQNNAETILLSGRHFNFSCKIFPFGIYLLLILLTGTKQPLFGQQQNIDSLLAVLKTTKEDTNRVNTLYNLSYAICDTAPDKAIKYAKQGLVISDKIKFKQGITKCNKVLGISSFNIGKFDSAKYYIENQLKSIVRMSDNNIGTANIYYQLSLIYDRLGEIELAMDYLNKSREIYTKLNEKKGLARVDLQAGIVFNRQGQYEKSLNSYLNALHIFESLTDKNNIAETLIQISQLYFTLKQNRKSEQYALESLAHYKEIGNRTGIEKSQYILSRIYRKEGNFEKSIKYLSEAEVLAKKDNNLYLLTNIYTGLALNYRELNQFDTSLKYFNSALTTANITKDIDQLASIFEGFSAVLSDKGNYKEALIYTRKSEEIYKRKEAKGSTAVQFYKKC